MFYRAELSIINHSSIIFIRSVTKIATQKDIGAEQDTPGSDKRLQRL